MRKPITTYHGRLAAILTVLLAAFGWLGFRLYHIQITRHAELARKALASETVKQTLEPWRGSIRDRNGLPLAISRPVKTIYMNLALVDDSTNQIVRTCAPILRVSEQELADVVREHLTGPTNAPRPPMLIRRNVSIDEWNAISGAVSLESFGFDSPKLSAREQKRRSQLRHNLLFAEDAQKRFYPYGETCCHLVGFTSFGTNGPELEGVCGLERSLNTNLAGLPGLCVSQRDAAGCELPDRRTVFRAPAQGENVVLTLDATLQQTIEGILQEACRQSGARHASAIIMDPFTGEILVAASAPGFDPHDPGSSPKEMWRNPPFTDKVEPGSTFKLVTLVAALDQKMLTLESGVYCENGRWIIKGVPVKDHAPLGLLTFCNCFAKSSNIAFAKTALALGPQTFYRYATALGFGSRTGIQLVDDVPGHIYEPSQLDTYRFTRAAYGQGISVSQLQMAVAMCAVANKGRMMRPTLIRRIEFAQGKVKQEFSPQLMRVVMRPDVAEWVLEALEAVAAPGGTAAGAAMPDFTMAVKTGTAEISDANGYVKGKYYSNMVGIFPALSPRVVITVALDEPQNGYYAGDVVAPVFRSVAQQTAIRLRIPADKPGHTELALHQ